MAFIYCFDCNKSQGLTSKDKQLVYHVINSFKKAHKGHKIREGGDNDE